MIRIQFDCANINWNHISETLQRVGMAFYDSERHAMAFANSHTVVFVFDAEKLVGFGRAISDGAYQAAIYDVAVVPEYQRQGIGRLIIESIIECLPECNFILYAAPGKEAFYEKLNFRKMKTSMALFMNSVKMRDKGFTE
ncbi:MAG: GNAT family N-acetyltransferase [Candidatus Saccharibacteria bacterium]